MRTLLPFFILFLFAPCSAQINAGEIPADHSAYDPEIDLTTFTSFSLDSASFDLDCDGAPDIRAVLQHGAPEVDAPHSCALDLLNPALELCADLPVVYWRPQYYTFGAPLECTGDYTWRSDSVTALGDFGGFFPQGPSAVDSMYVAYRIGDQEGWILLSFDLVPSIAPTSTLSMQIHQVLQLCIVQSVGDRTSTALRIYPNPVVGDVLRIEGGEAVRSVELYDLTGKRIAHHRGTLRTIPAPEHAGVYVLRTTHMDGRNSVIRFVRY